MPLSAGDKLGPYEILTLNSKGGMAETYTLEIIRLDTQRVKIWIHHPTS